MLCRAILRTRLLRERRHELMKPNIFYGDYRIYLIKRDERLQISSKTGRVPVKIGKKKQWALNGRFNKRLIAVLHEQQKS